MDSLNPTLVILAAGLGSRYGSMKQIDGFGPNNELIMEYSMYDAIRAGYKDIMLVISEQIEEGIKEHFDNTLPKHIKLHFVRQEISDLPQGFKNPQREKPWGTGHAAYTAIKQIASPATFINADDFYGQSAYKLAYTNLVAIENKGKHNIVLYSLGKTLSENGNVSRGICKVNDFGYLLDITEETKIGRQNEKIVSYRDNGEVLLNEEDLCSMNLISFGEGAGKVFVELLTEFLKKNSTSTDKEFYLPNVLKHFIKTDNSAVIALKCNEEWFGVTYGEDKRNATMKIEELINQGVYPKNLWGNGN